MVCFQAARDFALRCWDYAGTAHRYPSGMVRIHIILAEAIAIALGKLP